MSNNYIDPSIVLADNFTHYSELFQGETIYKKTQKLLSHTIAFPYPQLQVPVVCCYLWSNPKFSKCLPILLCYGQPGSAKSNLGLIAGYLRNTEPINLDTSTPVSLRNACNQAKFLDAEQLKEADGALLIADNAQSSTFIRLPALYSLFLAGYKRGTDKMTIAGKDGVNIEFWTFSNRILSTVEPIHLEYDFRELSSRCVLIPHSPFDKISSEALESQGFDTDLSYKPEDINFDTFSNEYLKAWGSEEFCFTYAGHRKGLRISQAFTPRQWEMSRDLIATGLAIGCWESPKEGKEHFASYFEFLKTLENNHESPLEGVLKDEFLEAGFVEGDSFNNRILMSFLNMKHEHGCFLERPKAKQIESALNRLGWRKVRSEWKPIL